MTFSATIKNGDIYVAKYGDWRYEDSSEKVKNAEGERRLKAEDVIRVSKYRNLSLNTSSYEVFKALADYLCLPA